MWAKISVVMLLAIGILIGAVVGGILNCLWTSSEMMSRKNLTPGATDKI